MFVQKLCNGTGIERFGSLDRGILEIGLFLVGADCGHQAHGLARLEGQTSWGRVDPASSRGIAPEAKQEALRVGGDDSHDSIIGSKIFH